MDEDFFYNNIQKALENLPDNFNILEEQVDIEVQMEYFEISKKIRKEENLDEFFDYKEELFSSEVNSDKKKEILSALATLDEVKAFRTIEKFIDNNPGELRQWATLALQESRMVLQSSLLDEQQVFISTGLGGKGQKLRYFLVFLNRERTKLLTKTQRKLLREELIFELKKYDGEFETIDFLEGFSTAQVMIPLRADLKIIFQNIIDECNQFGNFLKEDFILTNVKVLSRNEILDVLDETKTKDTDELEGK